MFKVTEENGFDGKTFLAVITVKEVTITVVKKKWSPIILKFYCFGRYFIWDSLGKLYLKYCEIASLVLWFFLLTYQT